MKLAIISDIHANLPALEAVWADIKRQKITEVWNLGDIVGYAPFPNEVIARLRQEKVKGILGNYDEKVLNFAKHRKDWQGKKDAAKFFSFAWTDRMLTAESRRYLKKLPDTLTLPWGGKKFLLVHASPQKNDEALTAATPETRFKELLTGVDEDVILCGHSHQFFVKEILGKWFVNPGSVGRPFDGDPRSSYLVVENKEGQLVFQNRRLDYLIEAVAGQMLAQGFPTALVESISRGKSLDDLKKDAAPQDDASVIQKVLALAEACHYEKEHARQVTSLALHLFDQLLELHGLGPQERLWLQAAGLLHDIGWIEGRQSHHKTARDIILAAEDFPLPGVAQTMVALVARYHRRGGPQDNHRYFSDLSPDNKLVVRKLAALLRIADGLDCSHGSFVQELSCQVTANKILIQFKSVKDCEEELKVAKDKADLFSEVFGHEVIFERRV